MEGSRRSRLVLIAAAILLVAASWRWRVTGDDGQAWRGTLGSDGAGYFAYHALFLWQGDREVYPIRADHLVPAGQGEVIKYMAGAPLMQAPFVGAAHWTGRLLGGDDKPSARRYALAIILAALAWCLIGLAALRRSLLDMGFGDTPVAWTLVVILAGTGLAQHTVMSPAMSHPYAFAAIACFLLATWRAWHRSSAAWTVAAAALLALVLLMRPVNGVVLLALPLMLLSPGPMLGAWWKDAGRKAVVPALVVMSLLLLLQPLAWWWQAGVWIVRPYAGEGFLWAEPKVWKSLFGAQKGLFFHWPLLLLGAMGMWPLWRRSGWAAVGVASHAIILVYVTSAWWSWDYGDSYGPRPYLDHLAVAAVAISALFDPWWRSSAWRLRWIMVPFIALTLFQSWQYTVGIIHPYNMDREKWPAIRLRTGDVWRGALGGNYEPPPYAPCGMDTILYTSVTPTSLAPPWEQGVRRSPFDGRDYFHLGVDAPYGPTVRIGPEGLPTGQAFQVQGRVRRGEPYRGSSHEALVVATLGVPGDARVYYRFRLNDQPHATRWRTWRHAFRMPAARPGEQLSWYVWMPHDGEVHLDDIELTIRAVHPCP